MRNLWLIQHQDPTEDLTCALISAKDRLDSISEGNTDISDLYRGKLIDIGMDIGDICVELGGMVGCTVYSDLCEGLEVLP